MSARFLALTVAIIICVMTSLASAEPCPLGGSDLYRFLWGGAFGNQPISFGAPDRGGGITPLSSELYIAVEDAGMFDDSQVEAKELEGDYCLTLYWQNSPPVGESVGLAFLISDENNYGLLEIDFRETPYRLALSIVVDGEKKQITSYSEVDWGSSWIRTLGLSIRNRKIIISLNNQELGSKPILYPQNHLMFGVYASGGIKPGHEKLIKRLIVYPPPEY